MGKTKDFEVRNDMAAPASDADLVDALLAFANGRDVMIWNQPESPSVVRRWSLWRERPSPVERSGHIDALAGLIDGSQNWLPFSTDSSGKRHPTSAVIEIPGLLNPKRDRELLPASDPTSWLAHMRASIQIESVLAARQQGYSLIEFRAFQNIASALALALLIANDPARLFAKRVSRCKWCHKFYLARKNPKGGPANRVYCTPDHREEHHNSSTRKATEKAARKHK